MEFPRQEYWNGLSFFFFFFGPANLPNPGIEPGSLTLQADSLELSSPGKPCLGLTQFFNRKPGEIQETKIY